MWLGWSTRGSGSELLLLLALCRLQVYAMPGVRLELQQQQQSYILLLPGGSGVPALTRDFDSYRPEHSALGPVHLYG